MIELVRRPLGRSCDMSDCIAGQQKHISIQREDPWLVLCLTSAGERGVNADAIARVSELLRQFDPSSKNFRIVWLTAKQQETEAFAIASSTFGRDTPGAIHMVNPKLLDQVMRYYKLEMADVGSMRFDLACQPVCIIMLLDSSLRLVEAVKIQLAV